MGKIGIDIIEIKRIKGVYERFKEHFLNRVFTRREIDYAFGFFDPFPHLAVRFAAKEAIFKATTIEMPYSRIEILGRPPAVWIEGKKQDGFSISLSHSQNQAIAVVLWEDTGN